MNFVLNLVDGVSNQKVVMRTQFKADRTSVRKALQSSSLALGVDPS
jgi:hypothetical protein